MVKIRLKRLGRTHKPFYRLAVMDSRTKRDGKTIEELGTYDPGISDAEKQIQIKVERAQHWISVGAQPSETAASLLRRAGVDLPAWVGKQRKQGQKSRERAAAAKA